MVTLKEGYDIDYNAINIDEECNDSEKIELRMHTIHAYPAKFPAFIASKAFEYARNEGVDINKVADIFCGCGTVALESKLHNYDFWGCDINPVATLIAKTKSSDYDVEQLERYYIIIEQNVNLIEIEDDAYKKANERFRNLCAVLTQQSKNAFICDALNYLVNCNEELSNAHKTTAFKNLLSKVNSQF